MTSSSFNLQLLQGSGEFFPALINAIAHAQERVQLETYILDFHGAGAEVAHALTAAAQRGVQVQLLVDGVGTGLLPTEWQTQFERSGVQCCVYAPLIAYWAWLQPHNWRRLHRKLCVVDGKLLFCGGINILDDWHDPQHGALSQPRLDFSVAITGEVAAHAQAAMDRLWWRVQVAQRLQAHHPLQALKQVPWRARRVKVPHTKAKAMLLLRDNIWHRRSIERAYRQAIGQARQDIIIANAYFLPGAKLRRALQSAAHRGVRVQLLLQGRYEYFMQYHGARSVYAALLQAGVQIHEYTPSFLHAKVAVIDEKWVTVGSSNLDPLSLLLAREANVIIEDKDFAQSLHQRLQNVITTQGLHLKPESYANRSWKTRLLDQMAYALMRLALWVTGQRY